MIKGVEKKRIVFNLNEFVNNLYTSILEASEEEKEIGGVMYVDDLINSFKTFLKHSNEDIKQCSINYVMKHPKVCSNEKVKSFILCSF